MQITRDLRFAIRALRGTPVVSILAIACIGLGIGSVTTVYSTAMAFTFRPLPQMQHRACGRPVGCALAAALWRRRGHYRKDRPGQRSGTRSRWRDARRFRLSGLREDRQTTDGSWQYPNEIRPPINGSAFVTTALAIRALRGFAPPVHRQDMELQVARGRAFLEKSEPDETQDRAFKLLGLVWSGAPAQQIEKEKAALIALQRSNGGWGQMPTLDPDAYATGQPLYALHAAGMAPTATTYRRGADYLLRTQLEEPDPRVSYSAVLRDGVSTRTQSVHFDGRHGVGGDRVGVHPRLSDAVDEGRSGWMPALRANGVIAMQATVAKNPSAMTKGTVSVGGTRPKWSIETFPA